MTKRWDVRFLEIARHIAQWSKDPSTKVGAVIVRPNNTIVSMGYNGFPRGFDDAPEDYADREMKLPRIIHAEMNAILNAGDTCIGTTLYTWPLFSCERCAIHIIQAGIKRVVAPPFKENNRWSDSHSLAMQFYQEADVEYETIAYDQ